MRWGAPDPQRGVNLGCSWSPWLGLRADACGKRRGTWLGSEQVELWEYHRETARCPSAAGKGKACQCS